MTTPDTSDRTIIVGVVGGTGSGKTTIVREILKSLDTKDVLLIQHDSYYKDRSHLPSEERANINYDHPDALETSLLIDHLRQLIAGHDVHIPAYDFATHTRKPSVGGGSSPRSCASPIRLRIIAMTRRHAPAEAGAYISLPKPVTLQFGYRDLSDNSFAPLRLCALALKKHAQESGD